MDLVSHFRMLFAYNSWANGQVLERAGKVREEDYFKPLPGLSFDTLHATLAHIFVAEVVWLGRWQGRPATGYLADARQMDRIVESEVPNLADLIARWGIVEMERWEYLAWLTDEDLERPLTYETVDGTQYSQPLAEQMAHVINHGTQFRSEAAVAHGLRLLPRRPGPHLFPPS
jgi:uncharacterized damage-inducible protein DinB